MRKLVFAVLLLMSVAGCATSTTGSNPQIVRSVYESFARGDGAAVLAAFDPQIVWYEAENIAYADRNPYRGPQMIAEGIFGRIMADWDGFKVRVDEIVDGGDTVVVFGRYGGTWKATGKAIDAQFAHVWKMRNGKLIHFQQYTDTAQFARVQSR
jgi:hypothetical protein